MRFSLDFPSCHRGRISALGPRDGERISHGLRDDSGHAFSRHYLRLTVRKGLPEAHEGRSDLAGGWVEEGGYCWPSSGPSPKGQTPSPQLGHESAIPSFFLLIHSIIHSTDIVESLLCAEDTTVNKTDKNSCSQSLLSLERSRANITCRIESVEKSKAGLRG